MTVALAIESIAVLATLIAAILTATAIDGHIVRKQEKELHRWS